MSEKPPIKLIVTKPVKNGVQGSYKPRPKPENPQSPPPTKDKKA